MVLAVQFSCTPLPSPEAVRHTVAPPPQPQLCACANGAAHTASDNKAFDRADFIFFHLSLFGHRCNVLWEQHLRAAIAKIAKPENEIAQLRRRIPYKSFCPAVNFVIARARRACPQ
jgi:hypothetical protein